MKKYKLIGLTGQTGAGKSAVAGMLRSLGAEVINADKIVAELYKTGSVCLKTISSVFGENVLFSDGTLNRKALAERAFSSKENTALLGGIVHPFVTARLFELLKNANGAVVFDAPQLFEANADVICDIIIAVTADENARLERIIKRDKLTRDEAISRMNAQYSESFFRENSDFIIENNGSETELFEKVKAVFKEVR